jgi:lipopolysaccharide biosynthesis regulator YciM
MRDEALSANQDLLPRLNVPYLKFQCGNCGIRPGDLQWQCPQCRKWDTIGLMDSKEVDEGAGSSKTRLEERP